MAPDPSGSASASVEHRGEPIDVAPERGARARARSAPRARAAPGAGACTTASARRRRARRASTSARDRGRDRLLHRRECGASGTAADRRHLLVARASGVQPPAGLADARDQLALDERVHVLVAGAVARRRGSARPRRGSQRAPPSIAAASAGDSTPARASAAGPRQAAASHRLRTAGDRSGTTTPNAKSSASGSPANRPDQRCAIQLIHRLSRPTLRASRFDGAPDLDEALGGAVIERRRRRRCEPDRQASATFGRRRGSRP